MRKGSLAPPATHHCSGNAACELSTTTAARIAAAGIVRQQRRMSRRRSRVAKCYTELAAAPTTLMHDGQASCRHRCGRGRRGATLVP